VVEGIAVAAGVEDAAGEADAEGVADGGTVLVAVGAGVAVGGGTGWPPTSSERTTNTWPALVRKARPSAPQRTRLPGVPATPAMVA
jgi:hypothetical protein